MTVFTGNPSDFATCVANYLEDVRGMTAARAREWMGTHVVPDGGTYGEEPRFHLSSSAERDAAILKIAAEFATHIFP